VIEVYVIRNWRCSSCGYTGTLKDKEMPPKSCPSCLGEPIRKWSSKEKGK